MKLKFKALGLCLFSLVMSACSSIPLNSQAQRIMVSPNPAPHGCRYVGQVVGNQGNFFTGGWTSNENMELGAMNDMKNKAAQLGANYIQLVTSRAGNTGTGGFGNGTGGGGYQQTNVTNTGNAYSCPTTVVF